MVRRLVSKKGAPRNVSSSKPSLHKLPASLYLAIDSETTVGNIHKTKS